MPWCSFNFLNLSFSKPKVSLIVGLFLIMVCSNSIANLGSTDNFSPVDVGEPYRTWPDARPNNPIKLPENTAPAYGLENSVNGEMVYRAQLQTNQILPRKILYEQEVLGRYKLYQSKITPLMEQLKSLNTFLETEAIENPRLVLQKLSAYGNILKLETAKLEETILGYEKSYLTYQALNQASVTYQKSIAHWIEREKKRETDFFSQSELEDDLAVFKTAQIQTRELLSQVQILTSQQDTVFKNPNQ